MMSGYLESAPIRSVEELLAYAGQLRWRSSLTRGGSASTERKSSRRKDGASAGPKLLVCHDMRGNYLNDKFTCGAAFGNPYQIFNWECADSFCYFSHNLLSIPPLPWVQCCKAYGVRVLGTFITEWGEGLANCDAMFSSRAVTTHLVDCIVGISADCSIDGWLINIENPLPDPEVIDNVLYFLRELSERLKKVNNSSLVLWYDSVTLGGKLDWQNTLNDSNAAYFEAADGIFTNYGWKDHDPEALAQWMTSKGYPIEKRESVYFGCDVFGRGTAFGGMFDSCRAVRAAHAERFSSALFAPGWLLENAICDDPSKHEFDCILKNFCAAHTKVWNPISDARKEYRDPLNLPFSTSFSIATGKSVFINGNPTTHWGASNMALNTSSRSAVDFPPFYDLTLQDSQFATHLLATSDSSDASSTRMAICTNTSYYGTSCLEFNISIDMQSRESDGGYGRNETTIVDICDDLLGVRFNVGDCSEGENSYIEFSIIHYLCSELNSESYLDLIVNIVSPTNEEHSVRLPLSDGAGLVGSAHKENLSLIYTVNDQKSSPERICHCMEDKYGIYDNSTDAERVWIRNTYTLRITPELRNSVITSIGLRARIHAKMPSGESAEAKTDLNQSCKVQLMLDSLYIRRINGPDGSDLPPVSAGSPIEVDSIRHVCRRGFHIKISKDANTRAWFLIHIPPRCLPTHLHEQLCSYVVKQEPDSRTNKQLRGSVLSDVADTSCRCTHLLSLQDYMQQDAALDPAAISRSYLGRSDTNEMIFELPEDDFATWESGTPLIFAIQSVDLRFDAIDLMNCPLIRLEQR